MEQSSSKNNPGGTLPAVGHGLIAPLANIGLAEQAYARFLARGATDPGMIVLSGPSGFGKSIAAAFLAARYRAHYVQLDDFLTKRSLLVTLCRALGLVAPGGGAPRATAADLADMVGAQLAASNRILIVDEFDFAVERGLVMSLFSLYEKSRASILLIGEESLPAKLKRWEKFDGRVLETYYAEPIGLADATTLAKYRYPSVRFAEDLLEHLVSIAGGSVRRVSNNLGLIYNESLSLGWEEVTLAAWRGYAATQGAPALQMPEVKRRVR